MFCSPHLPGTREPAGGSNRSTRLAGVGSALLACVALASCTNPQREREPPIDPDAARASIARLIPAKAENRSAWAIDMFAAFEALHIRPTTEHVCAAIAVTEQESSFQANPQVPGLAAIAQREIDARADRYNIPNVVVNAALGLKSPTGATYRERLDKVRTEQGLSEIFTDFIGMVPLGERLFGNLNPVHTGGPMQVSIAFAEEHAGRKRYPYPQPASIRDEVFTRRGGVYFGIAHLLDYPASYDDMLYRFADYNAGHYASRNVAFQSAVSSLSKTKLALDGDLLRHGRGSEEPSNTELAIRKIADRIDLNDAQIRSDLELGDQDAFERSKLYSRVFALADKGKPHPVPRAMLPSIRLESPKITRKLTTEWFARRVDERYEKCLARSAAAKPTQP
jgi:hypothetical protein